MKPGKIPKPTRPEMPGGYGLTPPRKAGDLLSWGWVEERMLKSKIFWVCTTRPDGRPHAVPVWGVWLDGTFYFGTDRGSRKARNLAHNRAVAVHAEAGEDAVILEGTVREIAAGPGCDAVDRAYEAKYQMKLTAAPGDLVVFSVRPDVVLAWRERDFNTCATRWILNSDDSAKGADTGRR
jgi:nitroimidazol reductase NimA-like FMN-containing flavoprotein (pyridoxamine 5'-phosphate oxidase superfamily)